MKILPVIGLRLTIPNIDKPRRPKQLEDQVAYIKKKKIHI